MAEEEKGRSETTGKHQVFQEGKSMRKSRSTDSLGTNSSIGKSCVCSPTKHQGSFRCRLHRTIHNHHSNLGETQSHTAEARSFKHSVLNEVEGESE
ncbi:hypothetical protein SLEP1_g37926 [Rubroshorea leprosula]|uniref:Uncharacterized protein n=1 Tax=Rubroshorea leprosula TaxID=152421 RepID=A0AAV5KWW7_9ROSI|nr:hypothetical protein SLEP1_g37926 [Rubroshorea leprosula]